MQFREVRGDRPSARTGIPSGLIYLGMMDGNSRKAVAPSEDISALWLAVADLRKEIEALKNRKNWLQRLWDRIRGWI